MDKATEPIDINTSDDTTINSESIEIENVKLDWPGINISKLNLKAKFAEHNLLELVNIETVDKNLKLELKPKVDGSSKEDLNLVGHSTAKDLVLPLGLPLLINQANMDVVLEGSTFDISNADIALYEGKVTGFSSLKWQKNWQLPGKFKVHNMSARESANLANHTTKVSGRLFADG